MAIAFGVGSSWAHMADVRQTSLRIFFSTKLKRNPNSFGKILFKGFPSSPGYAVKPTGNVDI
jgi:hypothetical protein